MSSVYDNYECENQMSLSDYEKMVKEAAGLTDEEYEAAVAMCDMLCPDEEES